MRRVECYCLFDITATGVTQNRAGAESQRSRNQQRNWDTMMQLAGMRTQIFNVQNPGIVSDGTSPFGADRRTWKFSFEIEPEAQWLVDGDEFWVLKQDSNGTPMITGLTESPGIAPVICTQGSELNVIYQQGNK